MASKKLLTILNGHQKQITSSEETLDFLSIKIGAAAMEIKQLGSGAGASFDMGARKLSNIADGVSGNDVATKSQVDAKISSTEKGAANGVATLDSGSKIPAGQLPNSIMEYKGTWNAATNTPTLADGVGNAGDVYIVSVSGTVNLGSGSITFDVSDWAIYNGSVWQKADLTNAVGSVNGKTGVVTLTTDDISAGSVNKYYTASQARDDLISQTIVSGTTTTAPSEDAVATALAGKSDVGHTHTAANITDFSSAAQTAVVVDQVSGSQTSQAPSVDAVKTALATKEPTVAAGTSGQYYRGDKTWVNFDPAAKAAAVVNSTTGSQTDQAASVSAMKSYVAAAIGGEATRAFTNKQGSAITLSQFVFESDNGEVQLLSSASVVGPYSMFGCVAVASIANNTEGEIYLPGRGTIVSGFSGLFVNSPIYASKSSAGGYQQDLSGFVAGDNVISLGTVISDTEILFNPSFMYEY